MYGNEAPEAGEIHGRRDEWKLRAKLNMQMSCTRARLICITANCFTVGNHPNADLFASLIRLLPRSLLIVDGCPIDGHLIGLLFNIVLFVSGLGTLPGRHRLLIRVLRSNWTRKVAIRFPMVTRRWCGVQQKQKPTGGSVIGNGSFTFPFSHEYWWKERKNVVQNKSRKYRIIIGGGGGRGGAGGGGGGHTTTTTKNGNQIPQNPKNRKKLKPLQVTTV